MKKPTEELPPLALVTTWLWMTKPDNDEEIREKGYSNILNAFNSVSSAKQYCEKMNSLTKTLLD
ncbi:hypothetical protein swp_3534 [Shewanella piezotolerans WP3]|uniref:Uncharacterized protein n=1 Tax=Shewanella piezotolerans (strain WP3 / JCM 13877) TaxID=225849 RepID=B8CQ96_SHEPW|nr:hypothetical protein [Shewanella piezotolerans]ACJ30226.1 hypothetical protein swp_3534 [Shewanella piezotolerans WP3]